MQNTKNWDVEVERRELKKGHRLSLLNSIYIERGETADWNLLHELHYKAENLPAGPQYFRAALNDSTIGVGVMSNPKMLLRGRNNLMPHMKPNQNGMDNSLINRHRAKWMNNEIRCNSRLVLDTMYRGAGVAYRMQNIMMRMTGANIIEFQSSMSKFNPFAAKAGPNDQEGVMKELTEMSAPVRAKCVDEMRKLYFAVSVLEKSGDNRMNGTSRVDGMTEVYLLKSLQQVIFASPLYGLYKNPDYKIALPARIPLLAFDNQPVDAPLRLDLL